MIGLAEARLGMETSRKTERTRDCLPPSPPAFPSSSVKMSRNCSRSFATFAATRSIRRDLRLSALRF
jgi:hypothetical protein